MLVKEKIGNILMFPIHNKQVDVLELEWFETNKRIMHKKTKGGLTIDIRFLRENPNLGDGDILFADDKLVVKVEILECDALVIQPANTFEVASICYEIGNKHLPLFYHNDQLLVAYDAPLFRLLSSVGYKVERSVQKLLNPLKTSVAPHGSSGDSLFTKIMKLTNSND
jgi:urease accessory protein